MFHNRTSYAPLSGRQEIAKHWRNDLLAALSVALVAIPLGLGKAVASGAPPMAGIITAIVGGILTTFIRGSHLAINGPGAGLIVVTLTGITALSDEGMGNGWAYYMSAIVVAGLIQTILGLLKWGKYADFLPSSVVNGMLAAIGVIIIASQIHLALDTGYHHGAPLESFKVLLMHLDRINLPIALIAINSLAILIIHRKFINRFKVLHYIPAPLLVLVVAIPFVYIFNLRIDHSLILWGKEFIVGPSKNLISIPDNFIESFIVRPNWAKIDTPIFWITVLGIVVVSSVESLMSAKAIEKLDPFRRQTDLNKDLVGVGLSTALAGFLGGLPVITVIVQSSININHGAKSKWSNFYHGVLVLVILLFFTNLIQLVPLAALAAILVYTGYKLASFKMFSDTLNKGYEQLIIVGFTLVASIQAGLIMGLIIGMFFLLLIHLVKSHIPLNLFIGLLRNPQHRSTYEDGQIHHKIKGVSNFTNLISFSNLLRNDGLGKNVIVDFSQARLVDHSILEFAHNWGEKNIDAGGRFNVVGLDEHLSTSDHPLSLKVLPLRNVIFLSNRQIALKDMAIRNNWIFDPTTQWSKSRFRSFNLFENKPIEHTKNKISGVFDSSGTKWEANDITFDEGAFIATEVHHSTILLVSLSFNLPTFVIEKETLIHKIVDYAIKEEIHFKNQEFSNDFSVKGMHTNLIKQFFNEEMISFLMSQSKYRIESNQSALLILKNYRFSGPDEVREMVNFTEKLTSIIHNNYHRDDDQK